MENQTGSVEITPPSNEVGLFKQLYRDTVMVLTEPVHFFTSRFEQMSFNYALGLGLAVSWIAAFAEWVTRAVKHETLMDGFLKMKNQLHSLPIWKDLPADIWAQGEQVNSIMPPWGFEGLRMLINPFHSLFSFVIYGAIFWLGAALLARNPAAKKQVTVQNAIKITAVASSSKLIGGILSFLPIGLGGFVGWIYYTALLMIGFSEQFKVSRMRGLGIVFLPTFVAIVVGSCAIGLMIALFAGFITSLFH